MPENRPPAIGTPEVLGAEIGDRSRPIIARSTRGIESAHDRARAAPRERVVLDSEAVEGL